MAQCGALHGHWCNGHHVKQGNPCITVVSVSLCTAIHDEPVGNSISDAHGCPFMATVEGTLFEDLLPVGVYDHKGGRETLNGV